MLSIRLFRTGKKKQAFFKIVVIDKRKPPRGGRFVEQVGFLNPLTKKKTLNTERIKYWLSKGAKPSDTIYNLLVKQGIVKGEKIPVHHKVKKGKEEKKEVKPEIAKPEEKPTEEVKIEEKQEESKLEEKPVKETEEQKVEAKQEELKPEEKPSESEAKEEETKTKQEEPKLEKPEAEQPKKENPKPEQSTV